MKLTLFTVLIFSSQLAFAATPKALKAVLDNSEVQNLTDISSLSVQATYRCPECYDVKVEGTQELVAGLPAEPAYLILHTEMNSTSADVMTSVIERSK